MKIHIEILKTNVGRQITVDYWEGNSRWGRTLLHLYRSQWRWMFSSPQPWWLNQKKSKRKAVKNPWRFNELLRFSQF